MTIVRLFAALMFAASVLASGSASAQNYPDRPSRCSCRSRPAARRRHRAHHPGRMAKSLGQPIVIEYRRRRRHDLRRQGRPRRPTAIRYCCTRALAAGMSLYPHLTFDAEKDFVTVGLINNVPITLAARPTLPPTTSMSSTLDQTAGTEHQDRPSRRRLVRDLAGVLVVEEMGVKVTQVPYRGAGPALVDFLADQVDLSSISAVVWGRWSTPASLKPSPLSAEAVCRPAGTADPVRARLPISI